MRWLGIAVTVVALYGSLEALADDLLSAATKVADCEWAAADKFDDGHSSLAALAQRVIAICTRDRLAMRRAAGFSAMDPTLDADELRQAMENVEAARKHRKISN
jgi:hypothetical protein